ncbi:MAG: hypothetical protein U0165_07440 [Polyangiaceae bacterium]
MEYPTRLDGLVKDFDAHEDAGKKIWTAFGSYADQDKSMPKAVVLDVVTRADDAGRSQAYVERARELNGVMMFFEREGEKIDKKVGGSVQYAAKSKGCNAEVYGAATHALKEALEQQEQESIRQRNEAHAVIERYRVSLGKQNATVLEKQADDIALASYVVSIDLVEKREEIKFMVSEIDRVKKTADEFIQKEKAFQAEAGRTDPEKKASEERITAMNKSKAAMDDSAQKAKNALPEIDKRVKAAKKDYADAIEALKSKLK